MKQGVLVLALMLAASPTWAKDDDDNRINARLEAEHEVPAVSSPARGRFRGTIDDSVGELTYELSFDGLQSAVRQAHIHFAQRNVNGGIMVWLCGSSTNPGPAGTQVCPQSGTITGTIRAANVLAIGTQSVAAGSFEELASILRKGLAYANVHTADSPGGEIRGQLKADD